MLIVSENRYVFVYEKFFIFKTLFYLNFLNKTTSVTL